MEYKGQNNSRPFKGRDGRDRKDKRRNRNQRNKEERKPLEVKAEKKPVKIDYDAVAKKYKEKYDAMAEASNGYNYDVMLVRTNDGRTFVTPSSNLKRLSFK